MYAWTYVVSRAFERLIDRKYMSERDVVVVVVVVMMMMMVIRYVIVHTALNI